MLILEPAARPSQRKAQVSGNCPSQHTVFGELQYNLHLHGQNLRDLIINLIGRTGGLRHC